MIPSYFGSSDHRLFGCYHPPLRRAQPLGIALCNPLGREYFQAHRTVRFLALNLAERGVHALRFDYYGTGDSDGAEDEADPESLARDVGLALDELRDLSGVSSLGLLGLRGGADVALGASLARPDVDLLILWDPITQAEGPSGELPGSAGRERWTTVPRVLLVSTQTVADVHRDAFDHLTRRGADPSLIRAPAPAYWSDQASQVGSLPVAAVQEAVEWLTS